MCKDEPATTTTKTAKKQNKTNKQTNNQTNRQTDKNKTKTKTHKERNVSTDARELDTHRPFLNAGVGCSFKTDKTWADGRIWRGRRLGWGWRRGADTASHRRRRQ